MLIGRLFYIRFRQMLRLGSEIGFFRLVFVFILLSVLLFWAYHLFSHPLYHWWGVVALLMLVLGIHTGRRDRHFIRLLAFRPEWVFWAEYMVLLLPVWMIVCFTPPLYDILLIMLGCYGISRLDIQRSDTPAYSRLLRFVPPGNFEWKAGFRHYPLIILLYTGALSFAFLPFFSLGLLWFMTVCMAEFYGQHEPLSVLLAREEGAVAFLRWKVKEHLTTYFLLTLPVILLYGIWNYETWLVTVLFYMINLFCFTFFIIHKYATYEPGERQGAGLLLSLVVLVSNCFLPLLLLSALLMIRSYRKAVVNLNRYLYDFR